LTLVLVFIVGTVLLNLVFPHPFSRSYETTRLLGALFFVFVYLCSGFVAGFVARRSPIMHGTILGLLVVAIFLIPTLLLPLITPEGDVGDFSRWALIWMASGTVLVCSLGAIFGDYVANRRKAA
jgi:hypothetical protein